MRILQTAARLRDEARSMLLLLALHVASASAAAQGAVQGDASAVFVVRQLSDTIAVERATISARHAEAAMRMRTPPTLVRQEIALGAAGGAERMSITVGRGAKGDSAIKRLDVTGTGDSGTAQPFDASAPAPLPAQRVAVPRGAVPFVNLSGLSVELMLRRARAIGGEHATVPLLLGNGASLPATVQRLGADSAVITLGGVELRVRTDAEGRLLGAVVPSQGVVFERLAGDAPAGAWAPAPTSYAPPPGAPYTAEDVVVTTPAGLRLAGTLTRPRSRADARLPAVVLITGSGSQDRDEATPAIPGYRPFREIADTLSRRGVAVLRLDDRGVGGSDAGPPTATTADFADDVRAAVAWLRTRTDIDPKRIGLVGHSEGALEAPMVAASDSAIRALVLIAAPAERGRQILAAQQRMMLGGDLTLSPAEREAALARAARVTDSLAAAPGWLHFFAEYDPLVTARRVRAPTLILQGATDRQVAPEQARTLADAMRAAGNRRVVVRTFARMNHLMVDDASGSPRGYASLPSKRVRRDFLGALADWVARTL
jgi:pimeloyl-ACP methyl ester carboxylesterase